MFPNSQTFVLTTSHHDQLGFFPQNILCLLFDKTEKGTPESCLCEPVLCLDSGWFQAGLRGKSGGAVGADPPSATWCRKNYTSGKLRLAKGTRSIAGPSGPCLLQKKWQKKYSSTLWKAGRLTGSGQVARHVLLCMCADTGSCPGQEMASPTGTCPKHIWFPIVECAWDDWWLYMTATSKDSWEPH